MRLFRDRRSISSLPYSDHQNLRITGIYTQLHSLLKPGIARVLLRAPSHGNSYKRVRSTRTGEVGRSISHGEDHKHTLRQLQNAYYLHDTVINSNLAYPLGLSQQKSSALRMITSCHHTMKRYLRSSTVNLVAVPLEPSSPNADSTIFLFFSCPVKYSHLANINVKKSSMLVTPIDLSANIKLLKKRD